MKTVHLYTYYTRGPLIAVLAAIACFCSLAAASAAVPITYGPFNSQQQAIASLMSTTSGQGRPTLIFDPIIQEVAQARAQDMATNNYFNPVNLQGVAANYLLRQAGYVLPAWWPTSDPTSNYVESIAAGSSSPSVTWTAWMDSPPHKEHLLAQNSFFASETHYGVGYAYNPNSFYQYYWVVITAPPEPIGFSTPTPNTKATSPEIAIAGSTDPSTNPASVQFRVENTTGTSDWQAATGLANWSGTAALAPGKNIIRAQSLNSSSNLIAETTCAVSYIVQGSLDVTLSGSGAVTAAYLGATSQPEGYPLTVKAIPAPGSIFAGWTGTITSGSANLTFIMQDSVSLQANFIPNPFLRAAGGYTGILTATSGAQSGLVRLALSTGGLFTGRLLFDGHSYSFAGRLDAAGADTVTIPVHGGSPITVTTQADLNGDGQITGTVSDATGSFAFTDNQSTFNAKTNAAPQAGHYTLVLPPDPSATGTSTPQGNGYASIVVGANGAAAIAGRLADGTPFSAAATVANDGALAVYSAPSGSTVNGLLTFEATATTDLNGTLSWTKAPKPKSPLYPSGFTVQLPAAGSLYVRPKSGLQFQAIPPGAATATFSGAGLAQSLPVPITISESGKTTMVTPGLPDVILAINPVSGSVSGTFILPGAKSPTPIRGVILQKQNSAFGYFRTPVQSGSFSLTGE